LVLAPLRVDEQTDRENRPATSHCPA
jgi:hypothetical protein